jgi:hypothetical protein
MTESSDEASQRLAQTGIHRPGNLLNESQRRSLAITLRRVELAVWRLEDRFARGDPDDLVLTHFTHAPSPVQRSAFLHLVRQVRAEIATLAAEYQLEGSEEDFLRSVTGEFTLLWSDLEDTRPQKLRRYGTINPQAYDVLGPPIQRLIKLMLAMNDVAIGRQDVIHAWEHTSDTAEE